MTALTAPTAAVSANCGACRCCADRRLYRFARFRQAVHIQVASMAVFATETPGARANARSAIIRADGHDNLGWLLRGYRQTSGTKSQINSELRDFGFR